MGVKMGSKNGSKRGSKRGNGELVSKNFESRVSHQESMFPLCAWFLVF